MMAVEGDAARRMDQIYRRQRLIYDVTRKYYLIGRDKLIEDLDPPENGAVLEIGCGTGRNLIQAAQRFPGATFHGIDVSAAMLETAAAAVIRRNLSSRIHLVRADATDFDARALFGRTAFDRVFISYTLSMIPHWPQVLDLSVQCLGAGGTLHIVDFGQQERLPGWFRFLLFEWLSRFDVTPRRELQGALNGLAGRLGLTLDCSAPYRGYAWYAKLTNTTGCARDPPTLTIAV
jgi:S-adenosylmethionine-diacylgycerolhomoserine-N-methlytransferase